MGCRWGEAGQVYKINPATGETTEIANTGGFILGMAFDGEENLYLCDMGRNAVLRLDTKTGHISDLTTGKVGRELKSPNFPVFHSDGRLFFLNPVTGVQGMVQFSASIQMVKSLLKAN